MDGRCSVDGWFMDLSIVSGVVSIYLPRTIEYTGTIYREYLGRDVDEAFPC